MPGSYNFFGLGPAQQAPGQDPATLAAQMQLQQYNNPTSPNAQPSQSGSGVDPQMLAKMMMAKQGPSGIPSDAQSYNTGAGPLPWLPQNALPWSGS